MKHLSVALMALITIGTANAQDAENTAKTVYNTKHTISIGLGIAAPGGDFAETGDGESDGYAMSGLAFNLDYAYNFHPNIAATFIIRSYGYAYDEDELMKNANSNMSISTENYGVGFFGVGIKGEYGNVVKGYINPFFGTSTMNHPEIELKEKDGNLYANIKQDEVSDNKLMYGVNFGAKFRLSELISLALNFEYAKASDYDIQTDMTLKTNAVNGYDETFTEEIEGTQPFETFNTTIQLGFNF